METRRIPAHILEQARTLYVELIKTEPDSALLMLKKVQQGELLAPDDWATVQESFHKNHPLVIFFNKYRNELSRQKIVNGKKYTAVAMITFTHQKEPYVLLVENLGLAASVREKEVQWTAHGTRVDEMEQQLLDNEERWNLLNKISGGDSSVTYFLAAAVRRISSMGIDLSDSDIAKIHLIDRAGAGFPEEDPDYRTEYLNIDLGERVPDELMRACSASTSSRYGHWTHCFKLADLNANIKVTNGNKAGRVEKIYEFTYANVTHVVRSTTWSFLKALQLVREFALQPEGITKDPWQLRNIGSYERALQWVRNKMDEKVQITIFSEKISRFPSSQTHAYAAKAKLDPENVAYTFLRPARLVLHSIIAHLTALVKIKNSNDLEEKSEALLKRFFQLHPTIQSEWEQTYKQMKINLDLLVAGKFSDADSDKDWTRIRELLATIETTSLDERHETIYHLHESNPEIARILYLHEKYQARVLTQINTMVNDLIRNSNLEYMECYPLANRQCFGVTGPVASGKSVSENLARSLLGAKSAAFISSDEWNRILSGCLDLDQSGYSMQRGKLTLAEAWFIKVSIWNLMKQMEKVAQAPNWIQEACDPASLESPLSGNMLIFINTADAKAAAMRVKDRGDKSGRYVSASVATGSYRWPWLNLLSTLKKMKGNENVRLQIMDTDVMFASYGSFAECERLKRTNIAEYHNGTLQIHNLQRFIYFIQRSFNINSSPRNPGDIMADIRRETDAKLQQELRKLFDPELALSVRYKGNVINEIDLLDFARKWDILGTGINAYICRQRFGLHSVPNNNQSITTSPTVIPRASL
jgi:hypothetical protein